MELPIISVIADGVPVLVPDPPISVIRTNVRKAIFKIVWKGSKYTKKNSLELLQPTSEPVAPGLIPITVNTSTVWTHSSGSVYRLCHPLPKGKGDCSDYSKH